MLASAAEFSQSMTRVDAEVEGFLTEVRAM
jgi:hypothetical protein